MEGKIIAVVGGPRSGKSFLVQKLADYYHARFFLEGEISNIPESIKEDITKNIRPLERILWFRNLFLDQYLEALALRSKSSTVFLDNFWLGPKMFVEILSQNKFEKDLMYHIFNLDEKIFPAPDLIINLKISEDLMKKFLEKGARDFDQSEEFVKEQALPVAKMWEDFLNSSSLKNKTLFIDRSTLDFKKDSDLVVVIEQMSSYFSGN